MTREDKLYSMRMQDLADLAEKYGIKINKKGAKSIAIEKILEYEHVQEEMEKEVEAEEQAAKDEIEAEEEVKKLIAQADPENHETDDEPITPKRGALIIYNGKAQNICAWAKELGKSANTLYGRIYRLGWSVEKAFTK